MDSVQDGFDESPVVRLAVSAVRCFGGDIDRETASMLLPMWRYVTDLTHDEIEAVLRRFPPRPRVEAASGPGW